MRIPVNLHSPLTRGHSLWNECYMKKTSSRNVCSVRVLKSCSALHSEPTQTRTVQYCRVVCLFGFLNVFRVTARDASLKASHYDDCKLYDNSTNQTPNMPLHFSVSERCSAATPVEQCIVVEHLPSSTRRVLLSGDSVAFIQYVQCSVADAEQFERRTALADPTIVISSRGLESDTLASYVLYCKCTRIKGGAHALICL